MDVKLVVEKGAQKGQIFRLRSRDTIVGRRRGCNLRIPSESVSRRHCRLTFRDDYLTVEDLASVNGTWVNGELIAKPTIVHPGDSLAIGNITFQVKYQLTPQAVERLLEEQQKAVELLPTFDANESSLPVSLPEEDPDTKHVKKPAQVKKKTKSAVKKEPEPKSEEVNPATSIVLEGRAWQLPSGEDIRDILSQLEKE
jgi:pSer/pThr/pTyr-binding forkhead associated (FHA) protein